MRGAIAALAIASFGLTACGQSQDVATQEVDDFASRVGAGQPATNGPVVTPMATDAAEGPPPANADVLKLEDVGFIGGVDLGKRAGTCSFHADGVDKFMGTGPAEPTMSGKGVVRVNGSLYRLDSGPGGFAAVKAGTSFRGEGFTVAVQPTGPSKAKLIVTDRNGRTKELVGDWNC